MFAQKLEPIDSLYAKSLLDYSSRVNRITHQIWPGMRIGPSCIFRQNGPAFLVNHPQPPANAIPMGDGIYLLNQADLALGELPKRILTSTSPPTIITSSPSC
ncbi:hypothetical protein [Spirosoma flavum]|uniref:hypothetical protein n=1 Tax=Spirosoma flavum TaxID=2048557 RepID=UPI0036D3BFE3